MDIDKSTMDKVLEKEEITIELPDGRLIAGSWKDCCKEFLSRSKKYIESKNHSVKEVVLTGGASKMNFVREYADEVFRESGCEINCSTVPSFSVSQGLVWVGMVDEFEEDCIAIVKKAVIDAGAGDICKLKDAIKNSMGEEIYKTVLTAVRDWANANTDESLYDLQKRMDKKISSEIFQIKRNVGKCVEEWTSGITNEIRTSLERELQKKIGSTLAQKMKMSDNMWKSLDQSVGNIHIDTYNIVDGIDANSFLNSILMWVIVIAYTVGAAIIIPIPVISSLAGFVAGCIVSEAFNDDDRYKARKQNIRNRAKKAMEQEEKKREIFDECKKQIDKAVDSVVTSDSIKDDIESMTRTAYEIMTLKFEV